MATTSWNDAEDLALDYLPYEAQVLYLRGLRRFMDYETGIVGIKRRISRKGLFEVLEVHKLRGSHRAVVSMNKDRLRALFNVLLQAGLIERVKGYESTLVFRLPLADFDCKQPDAPQSVSGRSAPRAHPERTIRGTPLAAPSSAPDNACVGAGCSDSVAPCTAPSSAPRAHPVDSARSAPHPESVIRKEEIAALVVIPPVRVDRLAVEEALQKCFADSHGLVDRRDVQQMVDRWMASDVWVKAEHVTDAVSQIRDDDPDFGFGPMYLEGVVFDVAAGKRVRGGGGKPVDDAYHPSHTMMGDGLSEAEQAENELRQWGEDNGLPFNPMGIELPSDYILRLHKERSSREGER